ncbi:MAG: hypothetical protein K5764_07245 [Prevotella sp.]|nr:hypothetical protein [Prevotella sp.]
MEVLYLIIVIVLAILVLSNLGKGAQKKKGRTQQGQKKSQQVQKKPQQRQEKPQQRSQAKGPKAKAGKSSTLQNAAAIAAGAAMLHELRNKKNPAVHDDAARLTDSWEEDLDDIQAQLDEYEDHQFYASLDDSDSNASFDDDTYSDLDDMEYDDE